jgi:hypothetical protein
VRCLGVLGRAAIVALSREALSFLPYTEMINKEAEVIGVSDHLASELPSLMRYAQSGQLTFPESALRSSISTLRKSTLPWMRSKGQSTTSER